LLLASRHFKISLQLDPLLFDAWVAWGNVLLQLGRFHQEHHFHLEAKEKYQKAIELIRNQPPAIVAELYWDLGIVFSELAERSQEALDWHQSIQAFQLSHSFEENLPADFWNDFGRACLKFAGHINDVTGFCLQVEQQRIAPLHLVAENKVEIGPDQPVRF